MATTKLGDSETYSLHSLLPFLEFLFKKNPVVLTIHKSINFARWYWVDKNGDLQIELTAIQIYRSLLYHKYLIIKHISP